MSKDNYCLFPGCTEDLSLDGGGDTIYWCKKHKAVEKFKKGIFLTFKKKYLKIDEDIPGKE